MSDETLEIAKRNHIVLVGSDLTEVAIGEMGFLGDLKELDATLSSTAFAERMKLG